MQAVLTPEQMAAADRAAIAAGIPSSTLMERAGRAVARAAVALAGGAYGRRVVVLCGKGNNAGDGLVAARLLAGWGATPVVVFLNDPATFRGDPKANLGQLGPVRTLPYAAGTFARELHRADAVVDALVGTGFTGTLRDEAGEAVEAVEACGAPVLAIDIPSGVDGATGAVDGPAITAAVTVTMAAPKLGLVLPPGSEHAGRVEVAAIGIPVPEAGPAHPEVLGLPGPADVACILGHRPLDSHKKSVGTVLIVAGSVAMPGAAALATAAALRAGAGLATLATIGEVAHQMHPRVPEAITLILPQTPEGTLAASALETILARSESIDCVAVGPGLTTHPETAGLVRALAARLEKPLVADADALNALAGAPEVLAARRHPTVLTPHPGEMSRLAGVTTKQVQADRLRFARETAARLGATIVLKGYRSIVTAPWGEAVVITTGGPALATGGTGDVLTGVTAALVAAGVATGASAYASAWAAAWLHGRAGDLLGERVGDRGVLAGDLPEAVTEAIRQLVPVPGRRARP